MAMALQRFPSKFITQAMTLTLRPDMNALLVTTPLTAVLPKDVTPTLCCFSGSLTFAAYVGFSDLHDLAVKICEKARLMSTAYNSTPISIINPYTMLAYNLIVAAI